uniref:Uncharacterized protein n=1 Tax=Haplochromis burtoni TaxID=8153 RepID=A0A3Q2WTH4_HAPBU
MTRWARANNVHKHKPAEATPWSQLRTRRPPGAGGGDGGSSSTAGVRVAERNPLRKTQPSGSAIKKPNGKKKQYISEDVNGFQEYLQQTGQHLAKKSQEGLRIYHSCRDVEPFQCQSLSVYLSVPFPSHLSLGRWWAGRSLKKNP